MPKDYYSILGVSKTASDDEIKKAFRRLAHEHHPDKGGDASKFKDVNEAYQVLSDQKKRQMYDQFGSAAFEQGGPGGPGFGGAGFGGFDFSNFQQGQDFGDLGDILGEMFGFAGGRGGSRGKPRGQDIEVDLELPFKEAAFGATRDIRLYKQAACKTCGGSGAEPGTKVNDCKTCSGTGQIRQAQRTMFGTFQTVAPCNECHGTGKKPEKACKHCRGLGVERREEIVTIKTPPGLETGQALRIAGAGEAAPHGGSSGDLYVRIRVQGDARFKREGLDVVSELEVPYSSLVLGATVPVETLDGVVDLSIPESTPSGTVLVIKNKGIPSPRGTRGNHRVRVTPAVPSKLSREQKKKMEELKGEGM